MFANISLPIFSRSALLVGKESFMSAMIFSAELSAYFSSRGKLADIISDMFFSVVLSEYFSSRPMFANISPPIFSLSISLVGKAFLISAIIFSAELSLPYLSSVSLLTDVSLVVDTSKLSPTFSITPDNSCLISVDTFSVIATCSFADFVTIPFFRFSAIV